MRYNSFNNYLQKKYGTRVHRVSLNALFSCPNRDGTLGEGGCIFCNEDAYSMFARETPPLDKQIEVSMNAARQRYGAGKFVAYFQNGTNTYGPLEKLKEAYDTIRAFPDIVGLFISTRPDCLDEARLDLIKEYTKDYEVWIELGIQTAHDRTLELINRKHTFEHSRKAVSRIAAKGIKVGAHLVFGLPGESEEDMIDTVEKVSGLAVSGFKFHVLHVLRGTALEKMFDEGKIELLDMRKYVNIICAAIERIKPDSVVLRLVSDAKENFLVAPEWMKNKQAVIRAIEKRLDELDTFQGRLAGQHGKHA